MVSLCHLTDPKDDVIVSSYRCYCIILQVLKMVSLCHLTGPIDGVIISYDRS